MDIKIGDEVVILDTTDLNDLASIFIKKFNKYKVVFISHDKIGLEYANGCQAIVGIRCLGLYETSNRKKLHDYIKASGYTSVALGEALGNKWYFSNITKPSRMKRGDISSEDLLHLSSVVDACGWRIEAIENTKDCNDDLVGDSVHKVESKKSNWMMLNKIAFGVCSILVILFIYFLYFVVSK